MNFRYSLLTATALSVSNIAYAQDERINDLERQLAEQQQRIEQLESLVAEQSQLLEKINPPPSSTNIATTRVAVSVPAEVPKPITATRLTQDRGFNIPGLDVSGDVRVRQEWNYGAERDRSRSAVRARVKMTYAIDNHFAVGTQVVTGDPNDPNSVDVTLDNFVDDFDLSLDQAWVRYKNGGFTAYAGKFPQILQRTDILWDGDVSPQGFAAAYNLPIGNANLDARGIWYVIDEEAVADDSDMIGAQLAFSSPLSNAFTFGLTGSYYHYRLGSITGADAGDFRGNLLTGGRYLSDFHLAEVIGKINWAGPSEHWPVSLAANFVRNLGANVPGDTAFNLELSSGNTVSAGDWRFVYNYSAAEVDSVLAAFSQDNIDLSTNYRLHSLSLSHVPAPLLRLDLNWYHYRTLDPAYADTFSSSDWLDRVRLAFMLSF